ncbi:hypothetical protein [Nocardia crassostreae]|uniref:hypothetical protein n=1 Tax=Nocardia crassostreae TaxID=53428 RepID=UPI000834D6EB|nr:hypothetical protein [Nocardia crassostreae]
MAGDIKEFDAAFVAAIAACVAAGRRVAIPLVDDVPVSLDERIRLLDAVMALLPCGARNCVTVSTWASYTTQHHADLTFSDGVQADQIEASIRDRRLRTPIPRDRNDYLGELMGLLGDEYPLELVVQRLYRSNEPLRRVADITPDVLRRMRLPKVVHGELLRNTGSVARVQDALQEILLDTALVPPEYLDGCVRFLASRACTAPRREANQARAALIRHWDDTLGATLGSRCRDEAQATTECGVAWLDMAVAAERTVPGATLTYLSSALRDPPVQPSAAAFTPLLAMVLHYLSTTPAIDKEAFECLVRQPHLLAGALQVIMLPASEGLASRVSRFLTGQPHPDIANRAVNALFLHVGADPRPLWLRPILAAASGRVDQIRETDARALSALGSDLRSCFVRVLFTMTDPRIAVDAMAPIMEYLCTAEDSGENRTAVRELVRQMAVLSGDHAPELPAARAKFDLWSLLVGAPRHEDLAGRPVSEYNDAFAQAARKLNPHWTGQVASNLADFLVGRGRSPMSLDPDIRELLRTYYLDRLTRTAKSTRPQRVREL